MPNLTSILALGFVLAALLAYLFFQDGADKAARITALELEAANVETERAADDAGEAIVHAGADRVQIIYRDIIREVARAPTSEACRNDPALRVAYDGAERMRDEHEDALRESAGERYEALLGPRSVAGSRK